MARLLGIVNMNPEVDRSEWNHAEEEKYGLGGARKTSKFYETYGIDVVKKTSERHLCQFVRGKYLLICPNKWNSASSTFHDALITLLLMATIRENAQDVHEQAQGRRHGY